ncbi:unnamed protein product [Pleuronectes platessa]|uniref:Uncharacterized protein n=1 Tax=Pleuronectes platessa TaxID=8262 RepID=A0A9N7UUY5_PLEPL|nr:unnamed protein product [Pleuronectes platessa]
MQTRHPECITPPERLWPPLEDVAMETPHPCSCCRCCWRHHPSIPSLHPITPPPSHRLPFIPSAPLHPITSPPSHQLPFIPSAPLRPITPPIPQLPFIPSAPLRPISPPFHPIGSPPSHQLPFIPSAPLHPISFPPSHHLPSIPSAHSTHHPPLHPITSLSERSPLRAAQDQTEQLDLQIKVSPWQRGWIRLGPFVRAELFLQVTEAGRGGGGGAQLHVE